MYSHWQCCEFILEDRKLACNQSVQRLMTDPAYLMPMRNALVSCRDLDAASQAHAFVIFVQWVNFYFCETSNHREEFIDKGKALHRPIYRDRYVTKTVVGC